MYKTIFNLLILSAVLPLASCGSLSYPSPKTSRTPDENLCVSPIICQALGEYKAWIDTDTNGEWDEGEPPFPGVNFWGTGATSAETDVSGVAWVLFEYDPHPFPCKTGNPCDDPGEAPMVRPYTPSGYRLTTPNGIRLESGATGFGFAPLSSTATPTKQP